MPRNGIPGMCGLNMSKKLPGFLGAAAPFRILICSIVSCSTFWPARGILGLFHLGILVIVLDYPIVVLMYISLMTNDVAHLFCAYLPPLYILFYWNICLFKSLTCAILCQLSYWKVMCIFGYKFFIGYVSCKYFFSSVACLFIFLAVSFEEQIKFWYNLSIFSLIVHAFVL